MPDLPEGSMPQDNDRPNPSTEVAKRLSPRGETLRELFLKSGNLCAFPGCTEFMMDADGVFVGEICHIEAAEEGGERFNPYQTNEERRAFENLMLMCHKHHVRTDDVKQYPVEKLKQMKAEHEAKFSDPALAISKTLVDETTLSEAGNAESLGRINRELGWDLAEQYLKISLEEVNGMLARLKRIPKNARALISIVVDRATAMNPDAKEVMLPFYELQTVCNMRSDELSALIQILDRHELVSVWPDEATNPNVELRRLKSGWPIWNDLAKFCRQTGISLSALIVDLEFNRLD
jgi:hypothetical protein